MVEMKEGKNDCEELLAFVLPYAEHFLLKYGEFFPFGAAMTMSGETTQLGGYDGRDDPPSSDVIELLTRAFLMGALSKEYKATALVYDASVIAPGTAQKTDAVAVELEHVDGYAVTIFIPYKIENKSPVFGCLFATADRRGIFTGVAL